MTFQIRFSQKGHLLVVLLLLSTVAVFNLSATKLLLGNFTWSDGSASFWRVWLLCAVGITLAAVRFPKLQWPASMVLLVIEVSALFRFLMLVSPHITEYGSGLVSVRMAGFTVVACVMARCLVMTNGRDALILSIGMGVAVAVLRYQYVPAF